MIYTDLTKLAMRIAFDAHYGQTDRGGTPYICHPLHVADQMEDEATTVIALLHDVLEDTEVTEEDLLREGIPEEILSDVRLMTRNRELPYANYIENMIRSGNKRVMTVKLADIRHNLDATRIEHGRLPSHLRERYRIAEKMLVGMLEQESEEDA